MPDDVVIQVTPEQADAIRTAVWSDTPAGYVVFYKLLFNQELPAHARAWVRACYAAWEQGLDPLIRAFRGGLKTTTLSVGLTAYWIGNHPEIAAAIIQASDTSAKKTAAAVADLIKNNPVWKLLFPHVVPDPDVRWGENGYEVKRTDMDYGEWRRRRGTDPTLVGYGITASTLIGGHPDWLVLDDLHDEENTRSVKERDHVISKLRGTVLPMAIPGRTKKLVVGTPWVEGDALDVLEGTGNYHSIKTPIYAKRAPGEGAYSAALKEWLEPVWPEARGLDMIELLRRDWGPVDFPRMGLLDLTKVKAGVLTFQSFPEERVDLNWPMVGGLDYAGTVKPESGRDLDYFAHCYGAKPPTGGLIIVGGEWGRYTQAQGETHALKPQSVFPHWGHSVVEGDGKGEEFFQMVTRNPGFRFVMLKTGGVSKHQRLLKQLNPHLEVGTIRISTARTPFLDRLRWELENWPNVDHDDCLDALYWCARAAPDVLALSNPDAALPAPERQPAAQPSPFSSLAKQRIRA